MSDQTFNFNEWIALSKLFVEQTVIMSMKHVHQKQRIGRTFLKETFFIPFFVLLFTAYIILSSMTVPPTAKVYDLHQLPPLSSENPWGIFSQSADGNTIYTLISKNLYYSPSDHPGVQHLIDALVAENPSINAIPASDPDDVISQYQSNLFNTWGAIEFALNQEQRDTGLLVTSETAASSVAYSILINTFMSPLATVNFTTDNYNDQQALSDAYWSTGYMTLQNFVSTYLARNYSTVLPDFTVDTYVQRYPKSNIYDDQPDFYNISSLRWNLWRWVAPTVLAICLFMPMLGLLTENVREKQFKMKDLLEISGLMNGPYWMSYLVTILCICQLTVWFCILLLWGFNILNTARVLPYVGLCTMYTLGLGAFSMFGGFLIFRSEYYGLPIFIINTALTVGGSFLALDYGTPVSLKLFISFLHPSIAFTMGIMAIETYLYHNPNADMAYLHVDHEKNYPALNSCIGIIAASTIVYFLIVLGMPFDWVQRMWNSENTVQNYIATKDENVRYPCDNETAESGADAGADYDKALLKVRELSHIYPDGTHAVKDMSFHIKEGEVLSFLGANGAGKSTSMGMLCGTLEATFGDAIVNGYSISTERTSARRNLGIAMQQDIIWNDVSVEDHLFLFGSLRGLHGQALRSDVDKMVESLGFPEKRKSLAGTLSGGQKRRLCVGISMVGGNSVVYLDEPTAGLDPVSRRQLWELVQRNRQGRAILLTTHFMDEADVLGDRIAIVKEGRLRALGTSKFLKKRFGLGYLLKMSLTAEADVPELVRRVSEFVPETSVGSNAGTELSLRLPKEAVSVFPELFESLEKHGSSLGMLSYGIETTTLEEVFMRIVNEDNETLLNDHDEANRMLAASAEERDAFNKTLQDRDDKRNPLRSEEIDALLTKGKQDALIGNQIRIMFQKRFHQFTRSKGQWSLGLVCPVLIAIAVGAIIKSMPINILAPSSGIYYPSFVNPAPLVTPVGGSLDQTSTETLFTDAFGNSAHSYVAGGYQSLFDQVHSVASTETGNSSVVGVYFENQNNFTVLYNSSYPIDFAGAVNNMLNSATRAATNNLLYVESTFQQLPPTELNNQINDSILIAILISLFVGSLGAGMSIVVGGERVQLVKHQQLASGASKIAYWTSNFCFDFVLMFLEVLLFTVLLACFDSTDYTGYGYGVVVVGAIPFIFASIFRFYCISFVVADIQMAQTIYFYGSLFTMFVMYTVWIEIVFNVARGNASNGAVQGWGAIATLLDPAFAWFIVILYQHNFLAVKTLNPGKDVLTYVAGTYFFLLIVAAFLYLLILFMIEGGYPMLMNCCFNRVAPAKSENDNLLGSEVRESIVAGKMSMKVLSDENEALNGSSSAGSDSPRPVHPALRVRGMIDPDVAAEREKVRHIVESGTMSAQKNAIFISQLKKIYFGKGSVPAKVAVKDVSISIPHGEVFGLLGANGAGKTTLLKMVSGQEKPSGGFALINGHDVVRDTAAAQRSMGLCPQFDTLVERLTVKENLLFFGQIKGLSGASLVATCEAFMVAMNIKRYQNKLIQQLSGGNRRKVSLAVALLGAPPTVYLDEPSTGLDPVASRLMWRLLSKISAVKNTAIVLTTHNMLECEAVCTRICIMKLGAMVCLGDSQHLRSAHGTGFLLEMTLSTPNAIEGAKKFVTTHFHDACVVDEHSTMINFEIPKSSIAKLSHAFRTMEQAKESLCIVDYALSQSTLEQVFLKQIRPNDNDAVGSADVLSVQRAPNTSDYVMGYAIWLLAGVMPGLHHFYLGNRMRGLKYLLTGNEVLAGWLLDLFEMHVLIQQSVQEHGHTSGCCKLCPPPKEHVTSESPV